MPHYFSYRSARPSAVILSFFLATGCKSSDSKVRIPEPLPGPTVESGDVSVASVPMSAESEPANGAKSPSVPNTPAEPAAPSVPEQPAQPKDGFIPDGVYFLKNVMSSKCFEFPESGRPNDPPKQLSCRGTSPQYFRIKRIGDANRYKLQNAFSDKYLQIKGRSMDNGGQVEQAELGTDAIQEFAFDQKAKTQYSLRSLFSGKVLDIADNNPDEGAEIHQWDYVGQSNQLWQVMPLGSIEPVP